MPSFKMPTPIKRPTSDFYWIRKKVPQALRPLVGKTEIWASLRTKDQRKANIKIGAVNAAIEAEWARLRAEAARPPRLAKKFEPVPFKLTHQDLHALRAEEHVRIRETWIQDPPTGLGKMRMHAWDDESLHLDALDLLESGNYDPSLANVERLKPLLIQAKRGAAADVEHARAGEYEKIADITRIPPRTAPALDFRKAFEEYVENGGLKGGSLGPTAKRWRPKIKAFCEFIGHRDLKRMTKAQGYDWINHLRKKGIAHKSIKDVWIAALSATAGFMVEQTKLDANPFSGMKVRKNGATPQEPGQTTPPRKGFTEEEAKTILTATLATPSHLISVEMRAARRWLPWLCAYSGARVNELTSLHPADITPGPGKIQCMVIKPSLEKTDQWRVVPIHSHVIEQKFLKYVEERKKLNKPLFYDPDRSRGGTPGNPQFKKVAERIGEWVHGLGIPIGVQPNHAWRHLFKSVARHVRMDREVEGFITGHRPKNSNAGNDYGDRWIKTMSAEIERYPRFKITALDKPAAPHRRHRRTNAEVAAAKVAKEKRKVARAVEH
jgi:integrase